MSAANSLTDFVRQLRRQVGDGPSDGELLARFANQRDEAAFADLVIRHGRLVLGVARRHLPDRQAAEDVAQVTFLALARQAHRLVRSASLVNWLYTVALRQARLARRRASRQTALVGRQTNPAVSVDPLAEVSGRELVTIIDDELARLPAVYRLPLLLCALEGLSREEAVLRLGWPAGSVKGRLERGRELLRRRLAKRGLTVPAVLAGGMFATSAEAMPAALARTIVRAAVATSPTVMPLKLLVVAAFVLTALGVGTGVAMMPGGQPRPKAEPPGPVAIGQVVPQPRVDVDGLPLPPEALARFGSSRMRHARRVGRLAVSPDGRTLVSSSDDMRIWDAATGKLIRQFAIHPDQLGGLLGFAPDGHDLLCVTTTAFDRSILRLDPSAGRPRWMVDTKDMTGRNIGNACLSPSNRRIAFAKGDDTLAILDAETGRELKTISHVKQRTRGLAFSPDDRLLAVTDYGDTIALYDATTGAAAGELKFPKDAQFYSVAFSPDGRTLAAVTATGSVARKLHFWDVASRKYRGTLEGKDKGRASQFAFTPDGKAVIALHEWSEPILWDTDGFAEIRRFRGVKAAMSAAFSPDGKTLFSGMQYGTILAWDVATGRLLPSSASPATAITGLTFAADGRKLSGVADCVITWDSPSSKEVSRGPAVEADFGATVPSPDGRLIASAVDGIITLWDAVTGKEVRRLEGERAGSRAEILVFTPDSRRIISPDKEKQLVVWDVATGQVIKRMAGHTGWVTRLSISADGKRVASIGMGDRISSDDSVRVWDLNAYKEIRRLAIKEWRPGAVAISPDGCTLAAGGAVRNQLELTADVHVWDIDSGREVRPPAAMAGFVESVAFSPDGRVIATGDTNGTLLLLEIIRGAERRRFSGHTGLINHIAFAPDGKTLASTSCEAPVYLWDIYGRSEPQRPPTTDELNQSWTDLASTDAAIAFRSIRRLIGAQDAAIALFREKLKPVLQPDAERVKLLIAQLDSPKFADRQAAAKELNAIADPASDLLRVALSETKSVEVRQALQRVIDGLDVGSPETLRALRSVEVLEQIASSAARDHLKVLADGANGATLTRAAAEALKRLASAPTGQ